LADPDVSKVGQDLKRHILTLCKEGIEIKGRLHDLNVARALLGQKNSSSMNSGLLLQVHDELVFDLFAGEEDEVTRIVGENMREALPLRVPFRVVFGIGANWQEASTRSSKMLSRPPPD
jgi:DNA polymerase I-like protein with 3'-5' exonuclease and polymerase domains